MGLRVLLPIIGIITCSLCFPSFYKKEKGLPKVCTASIQGEKSLESKIKIIYHYLDFSIKPTTKGIKR